MIEISSQQPTKQANVSSIAALMVSLLVAIFAFQLNASMLSPALATMTHELNTTDAQVGLTQTVFFTAAALFSLFLPRLADLIGRKKVLLGILIATLVGCALSAIAPDINVLMLGRVLQGASGPVVPMCLIMLHVRVTQEQRYAKLMAILTSVNGGIAGVDALLGGWLAGHFGFRSIFWTMAVICAVAVAMVALSAEESTAQDTPSMDWKGVVTLGVAFLAAYLAINEMQKLTQANWLFVAVLVLVAVIFFVIFWHIEKHSNAPMVSTHYMKERRTWGLLLTTLLTMTGVFAIMNGIIPQFAQDVRIGVGLGADVVSFATLTPYAIIGFLFGPIAGILASKFGYRRVLRAGILVSIVGVLFGVYVMHNASVVSLVAISLLLGISYAGVANIMLNGLGIVLSPKDNPGYLPGMNAGAFNLGAGLSFAILYAVMKAFSAANVPGVSSYTAAMIGGMVLLVLALASSLLIPQPETDEK